MELVVEEIDWKTYDQGGCWSLSVHPNVCVCVCVNARMPTHVHDVIMKNYLRTKITMTKSGIRKLSMNL